MSDNIYINKEFKKLEKRLQKQFKNKKLIGDIPISDDEYLLLLEDLKNKYEKICKSHSHHIVDILFAVTLIQIGIRTYKSSYWPNFAKEIGVNKVNGIQQRWIGNSFNHTLSFYKKLYLKKTNERNNIVSNILFHSFVVNNKANDLFSFLFKFYCIDLDRDLDRFDQQILNSLFTSIKNNDNRNRTYYLDKHTSDAVLLNEKGCKIRIRHLVKNIDRLFFSNLEEYDRCNRINHLLFLWAKESKDFIDEKEEYSSRGKTKNLYRTPTLSYNYSTNKFSIILPKENIEERYVSYNPEIIWKVSITKDYIIKTNLRECVSGYQTMEQKMNLDYSDLFLSIKVTLVNENNDIIKSYKINQENYRFFNSRGFFIKKESLSSGEFFAFSKIDKKIESTSLIEKHISHSMMIYDFQLEDGDIIEFSDDKGIYVGQELQEGIADVKPINNLYTLIKDRNIIVYSKHPSLVIKTIPQRIKGIRVTVNGRIYGYKDLDLYEIYNKYRNEERLYMIKKDICIEGYNNINIDIPNDKKIRNYEFVCITDLKLNYEDSPYVYVEKGSVGINKQVKCSNRQEKDDDKLSYYYEFNIEENLNFLFSMEVKSDELMFKSEIPCFRYKFDEEEEWHINKPKPIWYMDFKTFLYVMIPYDKIEFIINMDNNDKKCFTFTKRAGEKYIKCDFTKMLTYMGPNSDSIEKIIYMNINDKIYEFAQVINQSYVLKCELNINFDKMTINGCVSILGNNAYYIDIYDPDNNLIANKMSIDSDNFTLSCKCLNDGEYRIIVYEENEDSFGFEEITELYSKSFIVKDYNNFENSSIRINYIIRNNTDMLYKLDKEKKNLIHIEKRIDKNLYTGKLYFIDKNICVDIVNVQISFDDYNIQNKAMIKFIDEYDEATDFLYDAIYKTIVKEENMKLNGRQRYARYKEIIDDEYVYNIEFLNVLENQYIKLDKQFNNKDNIYYSDELSEMGVSSGLISFFRGFGITRVSQIVKFIDKDNFKNNKLIGQKEKEELYYLLDNLESREKRG